EDDHGPGQSICCRRRCARPSGRTRTHHRGCFVRWTDPVMWRCRADDRHVPEWVDPYWGKEDSCWPHGRKASAWSFRTPDLVRLCAWASQDRHAATTGWTHHRLAEP